MGVIDGRIGVKTGSLFVLKYIEYFIVFFMVVNQVKGTDQVKRFVFFLMLTCFITSIIGILQIPGGERVSAPFEGEGGEPNTLGGYLLFIGAITAGMLIKAETLYFKKFTRFINSYNYSASIFYPVAIILFRSDSGMLYFRVFDEAKDNYHRINSSCFFIKPAFFAFSG